MVINDKINPRHMRVSMRLGKKTIFSTSKPYIIAEIGVNHEGSIIKAKELIEQAKEGGADAIKFQTYKADKIAAKDSPSYWDISKEPTRSQHELFQKYDKFLELSSLQKLCKHLKGHQQKLAS